MDLTGTVVDLSGRILSLENNKVFVNQQLLQRPGLSEFSQYQSLWNRRLDQLSSSADQMLANIRTLQQLYVNLNMTVTSIYSGLTGLSATVTLLNNNVTGSVYEISGMVNSIYSGFIHLTTGFTGLVQNFTQHTGSVTHPYL
jgi:hypothetical protein